MGCWFWLDLLFDFASLLVRVGICWPLGFWAMVCCLGNLVTLGVRWLFDVRRFPGVLGSGLFSLFEVFWFGCIWYFGSVSAC